MLRKAALASDISTKRSLGKGSCSPSQVLRNTGIALMDMIISYSRECEKIEKKTPHLFDI